MSNQNEPRKNKSKEELRQELEQQYEVERQKGLIKTIIFPAMYASCETIADAKVLLEYASGLIYQRATRKMYEASVGDLKLSESMKDTEESKKYKDFFSAFDTFDVGQAMTVIDQLKQGIVNYVENKVDAAPLSDAKIEEILAKSEPKS